MVECSPFFEPVLTEVDRSRTPFRLRSHLLSKALEVDPVFLFFLIPAFAFGLQYFLQNKSDLWPIYFAAYRSRGHDRDLWIARASARLQFIFSILQCSIRNFVGSCAILA